MSNADPLSALDAPEPSGGAPASGPPASGTPTGATPQTPAGGAPQSKTPAPGAKLAGKFDNAAGLTSGIRSLSKTLGEKGIGALLIPVPADGEIIGEGKMFRDNAAAEAYYKTAEGLLGRFGKPADAPPGSIATPEPPKPVTPAPGTILTDDQLREKLGPKLDEAIAEYAKSGKLTDAQYADAQQLGMSRGEVDARMKAATLEARMRGIELEQQEAAAATALGGADKLASLRDWVAQNVPEAERNRLQAIVKADSKQFVPVMELLAARRAKEDKSDKADPLVDGQQPTAKSKKITADEYAALAEKASSGDATAKARIDALSADDMAAIAQTLI